MHFTCITFLLFSAVRFAPFIRPYMSGSCFLCRLRIPVNPFPTWPAFPSSDYYELIRTPICIGRPLFRLDRPTCSFSRSNRIPPKFLILLSIHATFSDPDRPSETLPIDRFLCLGFRDVKHVAICSLSFRTRANGAEYASGVTVLPVAYIVLCVRFALLLPVSTQHSIWVVG